jgi:hypothetical protein
MAKGGRSVSADVATVVEIVGKASNIQISRSSGGLGSSMVEQLTLNQLVCGSSPHRGTTFLVS